MITFGQPNDFAIRVVALRGAPLEPDPAAAATWVALELHIAGKNLTAHTHEDSSTFHTGIYWPAIYLARWFVRSWAGLFEDARWPIPTLKPNALEVAKILDRRCVELVDSDDDGFLDIRDRFVSQHALQAAAAGAVLPGIYLARDGSQMSVAWESLRAGDVVFHRHYGEAVISADSFLNVVRDFVDWTIDELPEAESAVDRDELTAWLRRLDSPEQARAVLLGYAGLSAERWNAIRPNESVFPEDFFGLGRPWVTRGAQANPMQSPVAIAFRCCSPTLTPSDLLAIRDLVRNTPAHPNAMGEIDNLAKKIPPPLGDTRAYEQGYELAVHVRSILGNVDDYIDIEQICADLKIPVQEVDLADPSLDGASICDRQHGPLIFLNRSSVKVEHTWGRRMVLAHELCHLLFDRTHAVPLAIISGPWAPPTLERRANAFAAELLLPILGMRRHIGVDQTEVTDEQLKTLMSVYKIGVKTCTWHVNNRIGGEEG